MMDFTDAPVGTKCFVNSRNGWYVTYIKRKTKTLVMTCRDGYTSETSWRMKTGVQVGTDRYTCNCLEVFSDKHEKIVKENILAKRVYSVLEYLLKNHKKIDDDGLAILENITLKK